MDLVTDLILTLQLALSKSDGPVLATLGKTYSGSRQITSGDGPNQADEVAVWSTTLTPGQTTEYIIGGASSNIDNPFGTTVNFRNIRYMLLKSRSSTAQNGITVSANAASPRFFMDDLGAASGWFTLRPGGLIYMMAPDNTGYDLAAAPSAIGFALHNADATQAQTVDIIIGGVST